MKTTTIPEKQCAVQLVGPDQLRVNETKPVDEPGRHQILGRVEAVGLCFSDLKLLKQFSGHARKSQVTTGIDATVLSEMPNYVPGDQPAVPGHETVVRIVKIGPDVLRYKVGDRFLVQTDYRWLPTADSNAAFGYNFEGALQEYVLMDERVVVSPEGESMLIPVPEDLSASAIALVEPWACVENSYAERQRQTLKEGGRLLVVGETPVARDRVAHLPGRPQAVTFAVGDDVAGLNDDGYDDIIYFGSNPATAEKLFHKLAAGGLFNIVQSGGKFGRTVTAQVGRVHYGGIRVIGTTGSKPEDALAAIPATAEIRANDKINVIGAAGPMGTMHVIRDLCQGVPCVTVFAGDLSDERLAVLQDLAEPLARKNGLTLRPYNPSKDKLDEKFDYLVLMAPVPALVAQAVPVASSRAIINIFAGIAADKTADIDLDGYIEKQLYFIGTSGSVLADMKQVLAKVVSRQLDTDLSVAAVAGLDGAIEGIRAVEKNLMPGKIIVYPSCRGLKLTRLTELPDAVPLEHGRWNRRAEDELLKQFANT
jgi:threonine dehydrogenase-like Zn-dependent dehydrogenase